MTSHTTFDVDVTGDGKPDHARIDMTRYLTGHRQSVPVSYYSGFQDGGEIYGKVIKQLSAPGDAAPEKPARWQYSDPAKYEQDYKAWRNEPRFGRVVTAVPLKSRADSCTATRKASNRLLVAK